MANKDIEEIRRELLRKGWKVEAGGKHWKCHHPDGGRVIMSKTPSGHYGPTNARRDIERLEEFNRRKKDGRLPDSTL